MRSDLVSEMCHAGEAALSEAEGYKQMPLLQWNELH